MPTIEDFGGFRIKMFASDHPPPHVHVVSPDFHARITIHDQRHLSGDDLTGRTWRTVRAFIEDNQESLLREWNRLNVPRH